MSKPGVKKQPDPRMSGRVVVDLVHEDLDERAALGRATYGMNLMSDNGRDHLIDAYQEALDLCMYLRAEIENRPKNRRKRVR
jgi:hypothetical protein